MNMLARHREQLLFWKRTLAVEAAGVDEDSADVANRWVDLLLEKDPLA
jgi:hypothetical protein